MSAHVQYAIVIEQGATSCSAYVPDLPGCVAVADTEDELMELIRGAIEFHLEGMREDGEPIPPPAARVAYVAVAQLAA